MTAPHAPPGRRARGPRVRRCRGSRYAVGHRARPRVDRDGAEDCRRWPVHDPLPALSPVLQGLLALGALPRRVARRPWRASAGAAPNLGNPSWTSQSPDPNFYVWGYALVALRDRARASTRSVLHSRSARTGRATTLAWVTTSAAAGPAFRPLTATAGPVVTFSLLVAVSLPVSAWAAFCVAPSPHQAILAGRCPSEVPSTDSRRTR